jgi:hypothetical protein
MIKMMANFLVTFARASVFGLGSLFLSGIICSANEDFSCSDAHYLSRYTRDREDRASWGTVFQSQGKEVRASCSFWEGHKFALKKLNWWIDGEPLDPAVWVYRGLANTCSQGSLLIFNERTSSVLIVNVSDFSLKEHKCIRAAE